MIRYAVDFDELDRRIDVCTPTWRARARLACKRMRSSRPPRFDEQGPAWSDIKQLYIEVQHGKYAYCERKLGSNIEHDIEHYRPKSAVKAWRGSYSFTVTHGNPSGYCMLAYEPRNYCVACKTCNTTRKGDRFPIAGRRGRSDARDIAKLNQREQPMIPYPLGDLDEDPEQLIGFQGFLAVPRARTGHRFRRARVTIDLLALDKSPVLQRERALIICIIWHNLERLHDGARTKADRDRARAQLAAHRTGHLPHTACARAFIAYFERDPERAHEVFLEAEKLLEAR